MSNDLIGKLSVLEGVLSGCYKTIESVKKEIEETNEKIYLEMNYKIIEIKEVSLKDFFENECIVNAESKIIYSDFYKNYFITTLFKDKNKVLSRKKIAKLLRDYGFKVESGAANKLYVHGIELKDLGCFFE